MENAAWQLWRHDGTSWIYEDAGANDQKFYANENGAGWIEGHRLYRWVSVGLDGVHVWQEILHTDKYAPTLPPQSVTISNVNSGLNDNHVDVGWAEAVDHAQFDLVIQYRNLTDPTRDVDQSLPYPRNGVVTHRFELAGANGDIVRAFLTYWEAVLNPFGGPTAQTADHTIT